MTRALAVIGIIVAIVGCAPRAIVVDPIAPAVAKASAAASNVAKNAALARAKSSTVATEAAGIAAEAMTATAEVDRLRKADGVKPEEFNALWSMVNGLQIRTAEHALSSAIAERAVAATQVAANESSASMAELAKDAVKHDAGVIDLKTKIASQASDAALGSAVKWLIGIAVVIALIFLAIAFIPKPRI